MLAEQGKFVKGTDYCCVAMHELGHVVANIYRITPMDIAKAILPGCSVPEILKKVKENVSLYAADYEDGREIISECFSAYYGNADIPFAKEYVERCINFAKEGLYDEK